MTTVDVRREAALDPTSLGNLAKMCAGLSEDQVRVALRHQAAVGVPIGQALVDCGFIGEVTQVTLVRRQKTMRTNPTSRDAMDMAELAVERLTSLCGWAGRVLGVVESKPEPESPDPSPTEKPDLF